MLAKLAAAAALAAVLGVTAAAARDETTAEFLARCGRDWKSCTKSVAFSIGDPEFGQGCPDASVSLHDATRAVVWWLKAHRNLAAEDKDRTIAMAANKLWPCPEPDYR